MEDLSYEALVAGCYNTLLRIAVQHTGNRPEAEAACIPAGAALFLCAIACKKRPDMV